MTAKYINLLANATDIEELWDLHVRKMAGFGFDRIIYGSTQYRTQNSLGDPEDFVILTNHERNYTDAFIGQGYYKSAPMVRWSLSHAGASSWRHVHERYQSGRMTPDEAKVYEFNLAHDVSIGYSISFKPSSSRQRAGMGLVMQNGMTQAELDAMWDRSGEEIIALNNVMHLCIQSLPYSRAKRSLTARQREVLEWVGDGKTTQDIAILMDLAAPTVEKHLRLAREALNVDTTAQAVLKASFQNQIFVVDLYERSGQS